MDLKLFVICAHLISLLVLSACGTANQSSYGPTIRGASGWNLAQECGYEHCYPLVDFLSREDVSLRIELLWGNREKFPFLILIRFDEKRKGDFTFDASLSTVKFDDGRILQPKGLSCSGTFTNFSYLRSTPGVQGAISAMKSACFYLFFDRPLHRVDEQFTLTLEGVTKRREPVKIPEIVFRNRVSK
jgi:hypothetical protein